MLIINVDNPNGPERAAQDALVDRPGVLVGNPKVFTGGRTRETDALVITPRAVLVVEAKGAKKGSPDSGPLRVSLNGGWTIAGAPAQFHGGKSAHVQARQAAQTFAEYLRSKNALDQFVSAVVSVTGENITMPNGPETLGDVTVCKDTDLGQVVDGLGRGTIYLNDAYKILEALDLGTLMPTKEELKEAGFRDFWEDLRAQVEWDQRQEEARQAAAGQERQARDSRDQTEPTTGAVHEGDVYVITDLGTADSADTDPITWGHPPVAPAQPASRSRTLIRALAPVVVATVVVATVVVAVVVAGGRAALNGRDTRHLSADEAHALLVEHLHQQRPRLAKADYNGSCRKDYRLLAASVYKCNVAVFPGGGQVVTFSGEVSREDPDTAEVLSFTQN